MSIRRAGCARIGGMRIFVRPFALLAFAAGTLFVADAQELVELKIELPPVALVGTPQPIRVPKERLAPAQAVSVKIPKDCRNLAAGKSVSASDENPIVGELAYLTDGDKDGDEGYEVELAPGTQWMQIDLGESAEIFAIALWHYHRQKRVYHDVVIQVADDPAFEKDVKTVFNNDFDNSSELGKGTDKVYIETHAGKVIPVPAVRGRYVRFYSRGNTSDSGNHYIEAEVYGK